MKTSTNGRKLIEQFEGCILQAYDDRTDHIVPVGGTSQGTLTIGYGHTSAAGAPKVTVGQIITKEQADTILASDLAKVEDSVNSLVKVSLTQNQFDALVSFQFNLGSLARSSVLTDINNKNFKSAADKILLYNNERINGVLTPVAGLTRRRTAERALFLKPDAVGATLPTSAVVAVGAGAALTSPHHYLPWIIAATALVAIATFIGYTIYEYKESLKVPA